MEPHFAQGAPDTPSAAAQSTAAHNSTRLNDAIVALPAGAPWLSLRIGSTICVGNPVVRTGTDGRVSQTLSPYSAAFKTELEGAGYKVVTPGEDNLIDEETGSAELEAAAVITDEHIEGCVSKGRFFFASSRASVRGNSSMKIEWQPYSRIRKQVVARASTSGTSGLDDAVPSGAAKLIIASFTENARELVANADFHAALNTPRALAKDFCTTWSAKQDRSRRQP